MQNHDPYEKARAEAREAARQTIEEMRPAFETFQRAIKQYDAQRTPAPRPKLTVIKGGRDA